MRQQIMILFILLGLNVPEINSDIITTGQSVISLLVSQKEQEFTPMEALDIVKEQYAANFDKIYKENSEDEYYYKLTSADYYLVYEEMTGQDRDYVIHLYEFVIDEPETGIGHCVTYGWYTVDRETGTITAKTE